MSKSKKHISQVAAVDSVVILNGSYTGTVNEINWQVAGLPDGMILKWANVSRQYISSGGTTYVYDSGGTWGIQQSFWEEGLNPDILNYSEIENRQISPGTLASGTYNYQIIGSYGEPNNALSSFPFISNIISILVP